MRLSSPATRSRTMSMRWLTSWAQQPRFKFLQQFRAQAALAVPDRVHLVLQFIHALLAPAPGTPQAGKGRRSRKAREAFLSAHQLVTASLRQAAIQLLQAFLDLMLRLGQQFSGG